MKINISPKVDGSQSRVQCSIVNFEVLCKDFITYKENNNIIRGHNIMGEIYSCSRIRNGISMTNLLNICKKHNLLGYSKMKKCELLNLIAENNIVIK